MAFDKSKRQLAVRLVLHGDKTLKAAGEMVGASKQTVGSWCKAEGITLIHRQRAVQEKRRKQALKMRERGCRKTDICRKLGISSRTAWKWFNEADRIAEAETKLGEGKQNED